MFSLVKPTKKRANTNSQNLGPFTTRAEMEKVRERKPQTANKSDRAARRHLGPGRRFFGMRGSTQCDGSGLKKRSKRKKLHGTKRPSKQKVRVPYRGLTVRRIGVSNTVPLPQGEGRENGAELCTWAQKGITFPFVNFSRQSKKTLGF